MINSRHNRVLQWRRAGGRGRGGQGEGVGRGWGGAGEGCSNHKGLDMCIVLSDKQAMTVICT